MEHVGVDRAYLITFHTYGTWLHGVEKGWVEPGMNGVGMEFGGRDEGRLKRDEDGLSCAPLLLSQTMRREVDRIMHEACEHRGWRLHAINVRTNHVHAVVTAREAPERVMGALKARVTRELRARGLVSAERPVWSRHGSTRWLNSEASVVAACDYVKRMQGSIAVLARLEKERRRMERGQEKGEEH